MQLMFVENGKELMLTSECVIKSDEIIWYDNANVLTVQIDPKTKDMKICLNNLK